MTMFEGVLTIAKVKDCGVFVGSEFDRRDVGFNGWAFEEGST